MVEILIDSIADGIKVVPLLFLIFLFVDFLMVRVNKENKLIDKFSKHKYIGGAILGAIPQCGIPVAIARLYSGGYITIGMLIAVFISSSDEALIIIGANPGRVGFMLQFMAIKIGLGIVAGFIVNLLIKEKRNRIKGCGIGCECPKCRNHKNILISNLVYTIKITLFLIATIFFINLGASSLGEDAFSELLGKNTFLQPVYASLLGMIPSCFSSVILAEAYIKGAIGVGALLAGLCANTGYGILIIVKEVPWKKALRIVLLIQFISISIGEVIYMMGW